MAGHNKETLANLSAMKRSIIISTSTDEKVSFNFEPIGIGAEIYIQVTMKRPGDDTWSAPIAIPDLFVEEFKTELDSMSNFIDQHLI